MELNSEENQYIFNVLLPSFLQNLYSRIFNVPYDQSLKMIQTTPLRPDDEFSIENCCIKCNKYFKTDEDLKCHQKVHENKRHMQDEQLKNKKKKTEATGSCHLCKLPVDKDIYTDLALHSLWLEDEPLEHKGWTRLVSCKCKKFLVHRICSDDIQCK